MQPLRKVSDVLNLHGGLIFEHIDRFAVRPHRIKRHGRLRRQKRPNLSLHFLVVLGDDADVLVDALPDGRQEHDFVLPQGLVLITRQHLESSLDLLRAFFPLGRVHQAIEQKHVRGLQELVIAHLRGARRLENHLQRLDEDFSRRSRTHEARTRVPEAFRSVADDITTVRTSTVFRSLDESLERFLLQGVLRRLFLLRGSNQTDDAVSVRARRDAAPVQTLGRRTPIQCLPQSRSLFAAVNRSAERFDGESSLPESGPNLDIAGDARTFRAEKPDRA